jgi:hypothetical protein
LHVSVGLIDYDGCNNNALADLPDTWLQRFDWQEICELIRTAPAIPPTHSQISDLRRSLRSFVQRSVLTLSRHTSAISYASIANIPRSLREDDPRGLTRPDRPEAATFLPALDGTTAQNLTADEKHDLIAVFELDILDYYQNIPTLIAHVRKNLNTIEFLERLNLIAHSGEHIISVRGVFTQQIWSDEGKLKLSSSPQFRQMLLDVLELHLGEAQGKTEALIMMKRIDLGLRLACKVSSLYSAAVPSFFFLCVTFTEDLQVLTRPITKSFGSQ